MVHNTEGMRINPDRNEKRVKHVKRIHAFPEKLKLIQVLHILGLNILVFVGEFSIRVLDTKMLCRTKELRESSSGSQVMVTIVARSLGSTFLFRADNLPSRDHMARVPNRCIKIIACRNDGARSSGGSTSNKPLLMWEAPLARPLRNPDAACKALAPPRAPAPPANSLRISSSRSGGASLSLLFPGLCLESVEAPSILSN
jgi:hypothetical protein